MKMPALILVAVATTLPVAPASPRDDAKPPAEEPVEAPAQKIKDLQKERIETLEKLVDQLNKLAQASRVEFGEVLEARLQLFQARLDGAEKIADRVTICKEAIEALKKYEEVASAQFRVGRTTESTGLKIRARRLEVEIQLEQMKLKEVKGKEAKDGK